MHAVSCPTLILGLAVVGLSGCSGGNAGGNRSSTPEETALGEVCDLIRSATGNSGRPPTKLGDFGRLAGTYPNGYQAVKAGDVVVLWGAGVAGEGGSGGGAEAVVAYEKNAPTAGGFVLWTSGKVTKLSVAEFASAPKAKK